MQRQSPWQHSSPTVSAFPSPPPLALLADKVYMHPPTPDDYDTSSVAVADHHSHPELCCFDTSAPPVFGALLSNLPGDPEENISDGSALCLCASEEHRVSVRVLKAEKEWILAREREERGTYSHKLTAAG